MGNQRTTLDLGQAQLISTKLIGEQTEEETLASLKDYERLLVTTRSRGHKLVDILDIREAANPTPRQRRLQADWNLAHEQLVRETLLGFAFVVSSVVMRGMITAVFWIKPLPVPHAVYTDLEEAVHWGLDRCRESGVAITSATRDQAQRVLMNKPPTTKTARG